MPSKKIIRRFKIKQRISNKVKGTSEKPRLNVFRSNSEIYVQVIDDSQSNTLVSASSFSLKLAKDITKVEQASLVGKEIAKRCLEKGITKVNFDRNGYLYHGRIKSLAEGAREAGLKF